MDELKIGDKTYLSSKRAAQITGYAKDYVGQLAREGRVEARLVGRSWYVLEESIRAHRFGGDTKTSIKEESKPAAQPEVKVETWEPATYKPEPISLMPEFPAVEDDKKEDLSVPIADISNSDTLSEMQAAWREWFTRKEELMLEAPVEKIEEAIIEEAPVIETAVVEKEVPIIRKSAPNQASEQSPIKKMDVDIVVPVQRYKPVEAPAPAYVEPRYVPPQQQPEQQYRAPAPHYVPKPRKKGSGSALVLQTFFVVIAGLAIVVAIIGSGYADQYIGKQDGQLDYLRGASTFERDSK